MIIHLSSEKDCYKYLPEQYPKLKIIYAHAGLPFWKKLWKYATDQPNVYVDTSSDYLTPSIVIEAVNVLGYPKVLFGCDGPYGMKQFNQYDYGEREVELIHFEFLIVIGQFVYFFTFKSTLFTFFFSYF